MQFNSHRGIEFFNEAHAKFIGAAWRYQSLVQCGAQSADSSLCAHPSFQMSSLRLRTRILIAHVIRRSTVRHTPAAKIPVSSWTSCPFTNTFKPSMCPPPGSLRRVLTKSFASEILSGVASEGPQKLSVPLAEWEWIPNVSVLDIMSIKLAKDSVVSSNTSPASPLGWSRH